MKRKPNKATATAQTSNKRQCKEASVNGSPMLKGTLTLTIERIGHFLRIYDIAKSDIVQTSGIEWYLRASAEVVGLPLSGKRHLACLLHACHDSKWSAWVSAKIRVVNKNGGNDFISQFTDALFGTTPLSIKGGWRQLIDEETLMKPENGYVVDDCVEICAEFTVTNVCGVTLDSFTMDSSVSADLKLIVEGTSFEVNKGYLSVISPFFRRMFSSDFAEAGKKEITLKDVKADDFKQFLLAVYPTRQPITDANVMQIFQLANYFEVKECFAECESHLMKANGVPLLDKLLLAEELNREQLKEHLLSQIRTRDVKNLMASEEKHELSREMLLAILEKCANM